MDVKDPKSDSIQISFGPSRPSNYLKCQNRMMVDFLAITVQEDTQKTGYQSVPHRAHSSYPHTLTFLPFKYALNVQVFAL